MNTIYDIIYDYHFNISTLLSFVDRIDEFLKAEFESHNKRIDTELKEFLLRVISKEKLNELLENLEEDIDKETFFLSDNIHITLKTADDPTSLPDNAIPLDFLLDDSDVQSAQEKFNKLLRESTNFFENNRLLGVLYHQNYLLYQSTLINLVTSFEVMITQIIRIHLKKGVNSLCSKTITLNDLLKFSCIEDAKDFLIEDEIKNIMFQSVSEWFKYLEKKANISLDYYKNNSNEINEIFARRNLLVHNAGYINSMYLNAIDEKLSVDMNLNDKISLGKSYIKKSMSYLSILGYQLIILNAVKHKELDNDLIKHVINNVLFSYHVKNREWSLSSTMYKFLLEFCNLPAQDKLVCQVNYWMSMKWDGRYQDIKNEVMSADFSDKQSVFQLCRLALIENDDQFYTKLRFYLSYENVGDWCLGKKEFLEWPVFNDYKQKEEYIKILNEHFD